VEYFLGTDPGQKGAAALLLVKTGEKAEVQSWVSWRPCTKGYRMTLATSSGVKTETVDSIHEVAMRFKHFVPPGTPMVLEGLFEGGFGKRVKKGSGVKCSEAAGEFLGPLRERISTLSRPKATGVGGWRRDVLGLPDSTPADRAEDLAVAFVAREIRWPPELTPFGGKRAVTIPLASEGAVAEAACMALHPKRSK